MIVVKPAIRPTWMVPGMNGRIPQDRLTTVHAPGIGMVSLEKSTARQWVAMKVWTDAALKAAGYGHLELSMTDPTAAYRTWATMDRVFRIRMTRIPVAVKIPWVTRTYEGHTWYLKIGMSPVAAPEWQDAKGVWHGGGNHGWASAIDNAFHDKRTNKIINIASAGVAPWVAFREQVDKAGFSWEGSVPTNKSWVPGNPSPRGWEPWHTRDVWAGVPAAVVQLEQYLTAVAKAQAGGGGL